MSLTFKARLKSTRERSPRAPLRAARPMCFMLLSSRSNARSMRTCRRDRRSQRQRDTGGTPSGKKPTRRNGGAIVTRRAETRVNGARSEAGHAGRREPSPRREARPPQLHHPLSKNSLSEFTAPTPRSLTLTTGDNVSSQVSRDLRQSRRRVRVRTAPSRR
jgi:hypothetical protein